MLIIMVLNDCIVINGRGKMVVMVLVVDEGRR